MTYVELFERFHATVHELLDMAEAVRKQPELREVMRIKMLPVAQQAVDMWRELTKPVPR